ncbi:unnamed protein product [Dibothriocephalus latus]|uniref:CCD97-like C-terminal domain-containing protein n=1 Tax=Dibothriocephalus latus TaxID=60516 RepID=A0A3P7LM61_DIBLA|nr:unnamed protein product [Dibothriocephalus latus]
MRERDPELWEDMVGRYASAEQRRALLGHQYDSFSGMLLSQILDSEMPRPAVFETDEDSSASSATVDSRRAVSRPKSRRMKREEERQRSETEFSEIMHSRFLSGLDKDFDYAYVDYFLLAALCGLTKAVVVFSASVVLNIVPVD